MITLEVLPSILAATPDNQELAIAPLVLAFAADPAIRWIYPDAYQYRTSFPRFVRAFGRQAFEQGTAHYVEGFRGTALWLAPGVAPDIAGLLPLLRETVTPDRHEDVLGVVEQMSDLRPIKPHWYLRLLGVDARCQRRGFESALLTPMLMSFDREKSTAYLEATNPENLPLYERHGFSICGEIQSGTSPTLFAMVRAPQ